MLFKIECYCDEKKLGPVHVALVGLVTELKTTPITNATVKDNKVQAVVPNGGSVDAVMAYLTANQAVYTTPADMRAACEAIGLSSSAYNHACRVLQERGVLGKKRSDGTYPVKL